MSVIYIVLPLALIAAAGAVAAFVWAVRTGQFDDLATPRVRMLYDDEDGSVPSRPRDETTPRDGMDCPLTDGGSG